LWYVIPMNAGSLFFMYLFYGLSFILLGFVSLFLRSGKYTSDILLKNLFYLGLFGFFHGLSEWTILFKLTTSPFAGDLLLNHIILFLNTISFLCLAYFGLLVNRMRRLPIITGWTGILIIGVVIGLIYNDIEAFNLSQYHTVRWLLGSPAALLSGIGLYREGQRYRKSGKFHIGKLIILLAIILSLYAIAVGTVFPFPYPVSEFVSPELIRTFLAIASSLIIVLIGFRIRNTEQERLWVLKKDEVIYREQMRMGRELHDRVLQKLFAAGLTMDRCIEKNSENQEDVFIARNLLSESSRAIRQFLHSIKDHPVKVRDFLSLVEEDCSRMSRSLAVDIHVEIKGFNLDLQEFENCYLDNGDDLRAILEEAVSNSVRHSGSLNLIVCITLEDDKKSGKKNLVLNISDKGCGFDPEEVEKGNGLRSMTNRSLIIGADFKIDSGEEGTRINLKLPIKHIIRETGDSAAMGV